MFNWRNDEGERQVCRKMTVYNRIAPRARSRGSRWHRVAATVPIIALVVGAVGCGGGSSDGDRRASKIIRPLEGLGGESFAPSEGVVLTKLPFSGGGTLTIIGKRALEQGPRIAVLIGFRVNGRRGEAEQGGSTGFPVGQGGAASLATDQSCVDGVDVVLVYGLVWQRQYEVHASHDGIEQRFRKVMLPTHWGVNGALVVAMLTEAPWRVVVTTSHGEVVMRERLPTQLLSSCSTRDATRMRNK
jgi:hypothetical protein